MAASAHCQPEFDIQSTSTTMQRREDVLTSIQMNKMKMCKGSISPNTTSSSVEKRLFDQGTDTFYFATPIVSKVVINMLKIMQYLLQEHKLFCCFHCCLWTSICRLVTKKKTFVNGLLVNLRYSEPVIHRCCQIFRRYWVSVNWLSFFLDPLMSGGNKKVTHT